MITKLHTACQIPPTCNSSGLTTPFPSPLHHPSSSHPSQGFGHRHYSWTSAARWIFHSLRRDEKGAAPLTWKLTCRHRDYGCAVSFQAELGHAESIRADSPGWAERGRINGAGAETTLCNGEVSVSMGNREIIKLLNYMIFKVMKVTVVQGLKHGQAAMKTQSNHSWWRCDMAASAADLQHSAAPVVMTISEFHRNYNCSEVLWLMWNGIHSYFLHIPTHNKIKKVKILERGLIF